MPRRSVQSLAFALFVAVAACLISVVLAGCAGLDGYDRTYSLSYTDGEATVGGSATFRPRGDGKTMLPPNGPDTRQRYDRERGYNFGGAGK